VKADALDTDGFLHRAREYDIGRGSKPTTMTCTCGETLEQSAARPDFERHLIDLETRDDRRAIAEARRKLDAARRKYDQPKGTSAR